MVGKREGRRGGCCLTIFVTGCLVLVLLLMSVVGLMGYSLWKVSLGFSEMPDWTAAQNDPILVQRFDQRIDDAMLEAQINEDHRFVLTAPVEEFNAYMAENLAETNEQSPDQAEKKAEMSVRIDPRGRLGTMVRNPLFSTVMWGDVVVENGEVQVSDATASVGGFNLSDDMSAMIYEGILRPLVENGSPFLPFELEEFSTDGGNVYVEGGLKGVSRTDEGEW